MLTPSLPSLDRKFQPIDQFPGKWYPILDSNFLIFVPYPRLNYLKTISFTVPHTYIATLSQSLAVAHIHMAYRFQFGKIQPLMESQQYGRINYILVVILSQR